jgi:hypothetical protein
MGDSSGYRYLWICEDGCCEAVEGRMGLSHNYAVRLWVLQYCETSRTLHLPLPDWSKQKPDGGTGTVGFRTNISMHCIHALILSLEGCNDFIEYLCLYNFISNITLLLTTVLPTSLIKKRKIKGENAHTCPHIFNGSN